MSTPQQLREYQDFMNWFESKYPEYYRKYARNITIPADQSGVQVSIANIDNKTYNLLFEMQNEYYLSHEK